MEARELLKGRRSVRQYKDEVVCRELIKEIIDIARFSPSWANYQVVRYTAIDDPEKIKAVAHNGVYNFAYNVETLKKAKGIMIISYVIGKSGKLDPEVADYATTKANAWEIFDAGIATQTFCLAAHALGVGTCIMGMIDEKNIAEIIGLPEGETVAALIVYGYPQGYTPETPRKTVDELLSFAD